MQVFYRWRILLGVGIAAAFVGAMYPFLFSRPEEVQLPPVQPVAEKATPIRRIIGKSVEGRAIEAITYGSGANTLLLVGGVHGGYEWNSVLLAYQMMDYLERYPEVIPHDLSVSIIPVANPDGLHRVIGKEGRFSLMEVPSGGDQSPGRFNANDVDLNRNFDCKWQPESTWRSRTVSGGTEAFSEPESRALRDFVLTNKPVAVAFWHSQSNAVYASECEDGILPATREIMNVYADAAEYPAVDSFDSYSVTGDAEGWLASIGIPAITVELKTHEDVEWDRNLLGVTALMKTLSK